MWKLTRKWGKLPTDYLLSTMVFLPMVRNHLKDLLVVFLSNWWTSCGAYDCFGWLERPNISPFCKTLKEINHTIGNGASVVFQRITLLLVSQAISKVIIGNCLLNLWSTWHKYISLTETTSIHCCLIYLIQLYLINIVSQLKGSLIISYLILNIFSRNVASQL